MEWRVAGRIRCVDVRTSSYQEGSGFRPPTGERGMERRVTVAVTRRRSDTSTGVEKHRGGFGSAEVTGEM